MSICAACGLTIVGDTSLCPHHHCVYGDGWAVANRLYCDGLHRGRWGSRLPEAQRQERPWWGG